MQPGEARSFRPLRRSLGLGLLLWLLAGCAWNRPELDRAFKEDAGRTARQATVAEAYTLYCPDVLEVTVDTRPDLSGRRTIGPDGRLDLGAVGRVRVEGQTVSEAAQSVAQQAGVPPAWVRVAVVEYRSRQLYVIGQIAGRQRAIPYQGPEKVLDLLHRVGGLTPGAALDHVYVVRSHVAEGQQPEVFQVDLRAILLHDDPGTNLTLQALDEVYVGETRQCCAEKCIPPWLRPIYETVCGMRW
jgi:protein involved in polysaccharide export with SLBB domain